MTDVSAPSQALEQFVLLAKSARGAAAAELVRQALDAPGVYVFAELLDMPHIKEVRPALSHLTVLPYGCSHANIFQFRNFWPLGVWPFNLACMLCRGRLDA